MWDHASSFTRPALLALMTGIFATAWSNDQQAQSAFALARRDAWRQHDPAAVVSGQCNRPPSGSLPPERRNVRRVILEMELPSDLPPGRYEIVEVIGPAMTIIVTDDGAARSTASRTESLRTTTSDTLPGRR